VKTTAEYIAIGFEKISTDLQDLVGSLQEVLHELGETEVAERLPWVGKKEGCCEGFEQAASIAFQLLNMVEENAAARTRLSREIEYGSAAEPGLWPRQLAKLRDAGMDASTIAAALRGIRIEPVLTAHPTEAKRSAVLEQHRAIYRLLLSREDTRLSPSQQSTLRKEIKIVLERLWRTGEILLEKPDIATERRGVMYHLREVFPPALARLDQRLLQAWLDLGFDPSLLSDPLKLPKVRFGTWVGGDRDGHPLVTAEVTKSTLADLRLSALVVLHRQLGELASQLPLSSNFQEFSEFLKKELQSLQRENPRLAETLRQCHSDEPWRQFVLHLQAKLPISQGKIDGAEILDGDFHYAHPDELDTHLALLDRALREGGAARLAESAVSPARRALDSFGFHLAALDIRQNSHFHDLAIDQLLNAGGFKDHKFSSWDEERRLAFLESELSSPRPFLGMGTPVGKEAEAILSCYLVLREHIGQYGPESIGSLIVSMTRRLSDLLAVYLLAREAGLARWTPEGLVCEVPVVPLFETLEDLERAPSIVEKFLNHGMTRRSLRVISETPFQQVMIGYSDSNKDCGIFASQWSLHQSQQSLTDAGKMNGVRIRFFHGRGGTISRGAGPTHRFLDALPPGSVAGDLRMTEQGETISQKYGTITSALHNLELLQAGTTGVSLMPSASTHDKRFDSICSFLSAASRDAYTSLISHPSFMEYFSTATPIDALETSRIGSRPSRRTGQRTLDDLRAIPWVFSWNQSRHYLPGWFGVGSALQKLSQEHPEDFSHLKDQLKNSPFLYYVLTNVETNIASADPSIIELYASLVTAHGVREKILPVILGEFKTTRSMMAAVFGGDISTRRPRMLKTLDLRSAGLRSLHVQQVALLAKWRSAEVESREKLLPKVLLSINAIASGLRTTG
jgi:phosphoenolpyruvate carboxylase